jgi:hypothetical protein
MNRSQFLENGSRDTRLERNGTAIAAGFAYFAFLLTIGLVYEAIAALWLAPRVGEATALALGLTLLFPCAWLVNRSVTRQFGIESPWPQGAIVAGTTLLLLIVADLVLLALLDPGEAKTILNHGWVEARFVAQVIMAALPFVFQGR